MALSPTSAARRAAATLLVAALTALPALAGAGPAHAASGYCQSAEHPQLAARLSQDLAGALSGRGDTVAFAVRDDRTDLSCAYHSSWQFDSASVVKVLIMGTVLRRAEQEHRGVSQWEADNLWPMITQSDNDAATSLWQSVGRSRLNAFLGKAGMDSTQLGPGGLWGLTQINAADELRLLDAFTSNPDVLSGASKAYGLHLMHQVESDQRWGTPYGAPSDVTVQVKNGWLPRAFRGWRVHSLGIFTGSGKDYRMAVLTDDNGTMSYGVGTIQRIAVAVHHAVNSAGGDEVTPDVRVPEISDGSAPFGSVRR